MPAVVAFAIALAYANSFHAPFLLDDDLSIVGNRSIRDLSRWDKAAWPVGLPTSGRPLLNLSFALNHAWGGLHVEGYHLLNLLVHGATALLLFDLVRRTMLISRRDEPAPYPAAEWCAFVAALLWALHPLATASVTYISQRAESLMAFWYVGTLYGVVRTAEAPRGKIWPGISVAVCAAGMATKEVMITAPVVALLFDRTFLAGSVREAWRVRRGLYLALAATWLLLAGLMLASRVHERGVATGAQFTAWTYAVTQCVVVARYAKLACWPFPLVFDYGPEPIPDANRVILCGGALALLAFFAVVRVRRGSALGFFLTVFFILLAPTSSFVPIEFQPAAENRVYLPLAALVLAAGKVALDFAGARVLWAALVLAPLLGVLTLNRNAEYADKLLLWSRTVAERPGNDRAHSHLAVALADAGRYREAVAHYDAALRLATDRLEIVVNRAYALARIAGRREGAIRELEQLAREHPDLAVVQIGLGNLNRTDPEKKALALHHYEEAVRLAPGTPTAAAAWFLRGQIMEEMPDRQAEVITAYRHALQIEPNSSQVHHALARMLATTPDRLEEAVRHYREAVRLDPDSALAHNNLGAALVRLPGKLPEAIRHYERAVRLNPNFALAHNNLGAALAAQPNGIPKALPHFAAAVRIEPNYADARLNLGRALLSTPGRLTDAVREFEHALQIDPESPVAHYWLAMAYRQQPGSDARAAAFLEEALRRQPDYADARQALAELRATAGATRSR